MFLELLLKTFRFGLHYLKLAVEVKLSVKVTSNLTQGSDTGWSPETQIWQGPGLQITVCTVMLLPLLLSYIQSFQNSVQMSVFPSYVVFFTGSLGCCPKELWGKCHPATLQIKARKREAHQYCCGRGEDSYPAAASIGYCLSGWLLRGHRLF